MKCKYCGGEIRLEDMVCPFCGRPNEEAAQHASDMQRYQYEFQRTKQSVEEKAGRSAAKTAKVAVIAVLLMLIGVNIFLQMQSSSIVWDLERKAAAKKAPGYAPDLAAYLDEGDYIGFVSFIYAKHIDCYNGPFEKYYPLYRISSQFKYAVEQIERLLYRKQYGGNSSAVKYLAEYINSFYEALDPSDYEYYEGYDTEETARHIEAMKDDMAALLETYVGLTKEEAESMDTLTAGGRTVLIERGAAELYEEADENGGA